MFSFIFSLSSLKDVAQKQYSHKEAEMGAGRSIEVLPPAHGGMKAQNKHNESMELSEDDSDDNDSDDE
jgi:hypothetical protein